MAKVGAAAAQKKTTKTPVQAVPVAAQTAPELTGMAAVPQQQAVAASVGAPSYPATERNYYTPTMAPAEIRQQAYRMMNDRKYDNFPLVNDYDLMKEGARVRQGQKRANKQAAPRLAGTDSYSGLTGYRAYSPQNVVATAGYQTFPATERNYYTATMSPAQIRQQAYQMMLDRQYGNFPLVNDYELMKERARMEDYMSNRRKF